MSQRIITREELEAIEARDREPLCEGCLRVRVDHRDDLCPGCEARYHALDGTYDSVDELRSAAINFRERVAFATALWRPEYRPATDVSAARKEFLAACEAVVAAADEMFREYGYAEAVS